MKKVFYQHKITLVCFLLMLLAPYLTSAQEQPELTLFVNKIPFIDGNASIEGYANAIYIGSIAIASFIAIFRLIWAGTKLTVSDSVSGRQDAKGAIFDSILGLIIILGAVTILTTVNPNLKNLNFLQSATNINNPSAQNANSGANPGANSNPLENTPVVQGETSCPSGQTLEKKIVDGRVTGSCRTTNPDAPQPGSYITGGSGTQSQILNLKIKDDQGNDTQENKFKDMAAYETWCTSQGGLVITELLDTLNYRCMYYPQI